MTIKENIFTLVRLIRLPNLAIIILTQILLRYCIVKPILFSGAPELISGNLDFFLLVITTVLIAIGGYVINDCFDITIDEINRPGKNSIGKGINERAALRLYWLVNGLATAIGFFLSYKLKSLTFGLIFPVISILLWFYSAKYKRTFLLGNIIISLLSALVIFIVWYFEFLHLWLNPENFVMVLDNVKITTSFFLVYGLFAFLVSLFREIIKDIEDAKGDKQNQCRTLPVVIGLKKSIYVVAFLIFSVVLLVGYCCWIAYNLLQMGIFFYLVLVVGVPLVYMMVKVFFSHENEDFHFLSSLCKLVMVAGILTMQLILVAN